MVQNKLLRISQINAVYLDNEILKCFETLIHDALKYLPVKLTATCDPELLLISKLYILYNALFKNESTFGQNLLAIKYENLTATKKYLYLFGCSLGYAKQRIERQKLSSWLHDLIFHLDTFFKVYSLWNISCFLLYGEKPRLIERILGLNQTYAYDSAQRTFNSKYLARELLWNGFIEILVYILPLINYHRIRRGLRKMFQSRTANKVTVTGRNLTVDTKCAYCNEIVILPYHMGCCHIYCYVCLKGNQDADWKFECIVCGHGNPNVVCERVTCPVG